MSGSRLFARRNGVGVVLLLIALSIPTIGVTPAQALAPTVGAFLPITGSPGTSVVIAGLGFNDLSPATAVRFNGTAATFTVDSMLQITATVPAGATTGVISVTDSEGTSSSLVPFTVTAPPSPIVASFLPLVGATGTAVSLTGTGFSGATSVKFNGTSATFSVGSDIAISTSVPAGATTGSISVTTAGGTGTSVLAFTVSGSPSPVHYDRKMTLRLRRARVASGRLSMADWWAPCAAGVVIKIQRRGHHGWKTVATVRTKPKGRFSRSTSRPGIYRALAPRVVLNDGAQVCGRSASPPRHRA